MRKSWQTTEHWFSLATMVGIALISFKSGLSARQMIWSVCLIMSAYTLSRTLFKRYRGMFDNGYNTSEFRSSLIQINVSLVLYIWGGLPAIDTCWSMAIACAVYSLSRGIIKSRSQKIKISSEGSVII